MRARYTPTRAVADRQRLRVLFRELGRHLLAASDEMDGADPRRTVRHLRAAERELGLTADVLSGRAA
jgi:hypothetical protein